MKKLALALVLGFSDVAARLLQSCGTTLTWMSSGRCRTTLVKGEVSVQDIPSPYRFESTRYTLTVAT